MEERAVPRGGMAIVGGGRVTSGTHSPMLDIGHRSGHICRLPSPEPGEMIMIDVRGKERRAHVVQKPIYKREE